MKYNEKKTVNECGAVNLQVCHRLVQHEHRSFELGACDKAVPVLVKIAEHGLDLQPHQPHFHALNRACMVGELG